MMTSPSIPEALAWLRSGELQVSPDLRKRIAPDDADFERRAMAIKTAFSGTQGELALQTILQMSVFRPQVDHRLETEAQYTRYAQHRAGQDSLATAILAYFNHQPKGAAHDGPQPSSRPQPFATGLRTDAGAEFGADDGAADDGGADPTFG